MNKARGIYVIHEEAKGYRLYIYLMKKVRDIHVFYQEGNRGYTHIFHDVQGLFIVFM